MIAKKGLKKMNLIGRLVVLLLTAVQVVCEKCSNLAKWKADGFDSVLSSKTLLQTRKPREEKEQQQQSTPNSPSRVRKNENVSKSHAEEEDGEVLRPKKVKNRKRPKETAARRSAPSFEEEADPDPGGRSNSKPTTTTANRKEADSLPAPPMDAAPSACPPLKPGLSRRQRKNRTRRSEDPSPPVGEAKAPSAQAGPKKAYTPLRQHGKLALSDRALAPLLRHYLLSPEQMLILGYPVETLESPGRAIIYRGGGWERCASSSDADSGRGSGSEEEEPSAAVVRRKCVRCGRGFALSAASGSYVSAEPCTYHWGRLERQSGYACCREAKEAQGCTRGRCHVWDGVGAGFNGPFDSFVKTKVRRTPPHDGNFGIYALDCEMCYTSNGLELVKISVIATDGRLVYDSLVRPDSAIVDYNTRFSGITARDLKEKRKKGVKSLREVQNDLMGFINADTILVGHGLENDLRALRMIHPTVVDTTAAFPHYKGLPFRRSLKSLAAVILRRDIQAVARQHCSREDAQASMELMLWKVRKDFKLLLDQL